jgi:DNA-binding MarR family transcriptional regulator
MVHNNVAVAVGQVNGWNPCRVASPTCDPASKHRRMNSNGKLKKVSRAKAPAHPSRRRTRVAPAQGERPAGEPPVAVNEGELNSLIGYALRRAQLRVFEDFYEALSVEGITPARFSALILIESNPGIGQTTLAETLDIARSGVVNLIDTLQKLGLVNRQPIEADKRAYALYLTRTGATTLQRIRKQVAVHEARVCARLGKAEKRALLDMLSRIGAIP